MASSLPKDSESPNHGTIGLNSRNPGKTLLCNWVGKKLHFGLSNLCCKSQKMNWAILNIFYFREPQRSKLIIWPTNCPREISIGWIRHYTKGFVAFSAPMVDGRTVRNKNVDDGGDDEICLEIGQPPSDGRNGNRPPRRKAPRLSGHDTWAYLKWQVPQSTQICFIPHRSNKFHPDLNSSLIDISSTQMN